MASGELATVNEPDLPAGFVITSSGRISGVTEPGDGVSGLPVPDEPTWSRSTTR